MHKLVTVLDGRRVEGNGFESMINIPNLEDNHVFLSFGGYSTESIYFVPEELLRTLGNIGFDTDAAVMTLLLFLHQSLTAQGANNGPCTVTYLDSTFSVVRKVDSSVGTPVGSLLTINRSLVGPEEA